MESKNLKTLNNMLNSNITHTELSLEIGFGQIHHPLVSEKNETEHFTQNWQE